MLFCTIGSDKHVSSIYCIYSLSHFQTDKGNVTESLRKVCVCVCVECKY